MLNKIEKLSENEFTEVFGNIFENANWIAKKLYGQKPFDDFQDLINKMISVFDKSDNQIKLEILNSHPDLADKIKISSLTQDSFKEQRSARLDECTEEEFYEFKNLNSQYKSKFGFPFIIAVKGKDRLKILLSFKKRILSDQETEFNEAIKEVKQIAILRLGELKKKII